MTPISITLENFRSIKTPLTFTFPQGPGLYLMRGSNLAQPRLDGNGVGKSTIWDALFWLDHGKTPKGLKAGDVCTWGQQKGTRVTYRYEDSEGELCEMVRTWGPISATLNGDDITKLPPAISPAVFLNCILMAQGQPHFLDLDPTAKAALFSAVLGLDVWEERSAKASAAAVQVDGKVRVLEATVASCEAERRAVAAQTVGESSEAWEEQRARRLAAILREYGGIVDEVNEHHSHLARAEEHLAKQRDSHSKAKAKAEEVAAVEKAAYLRWSAADKKDREERAVVEFLRKQHEDIHNRDTCPACLQEISQRHKRDIWAQYQSDLADGKGARERRAQELQELQETADQALRELELVEKKAKEEEEKLRTAERDLGTRKHAISLLESKLDRLEDQATLAEEERNPFLDMEEERQRKLKSATARLAAAERDLEDLRQRHALTHLWVKGFKEIRLELISGALTQLEVEVNSALGQLGLPDWSILFDVDSETKSGTLRRGFAVKVLSPGNAAPVPWAAWSGGEAQRLRLACTMGFADMVRGAMGIDYPLEVWDEPTAWLSGQGVMDLLDCLAIRAQEEQRQIWVVDHRTLGYGGFSGIATLVRRASGTTLEWS